jgi:hypothetical protein
VGLSVGRPLWEADRPVGDVDALDETLVFGVRVPVGVRVTGNDDESEKVGDRDRVAVAET